MTVREVDYSYVTQNMGPIVKMATKAFMQNHQVTKDAYNKTSEEYKAKFKELLDKSTQDVIHQCEKNKGKFFIAEEGNKIVGISLGAPYGPSGLSEAFIKSVFESNCCFKDVMNGWWGLMGKYEGTPPGKIYHQGVMAVHPKHAGKGIGEKLCNLTAQKIFSDGYIGFATETSSKSVDLLTEKMKKRFAITDVDTKNALTLRLYLQPGDLSEKVHQWFLDKKEVKIDAIKIDALAISKVGSHNNVGNIAVWDSSPESDLPVLVMLHPNSCSRLFFKNQMEDKRLTDSYRLIAIDLPGHGDSQPADHPETTYTFPGYAKEVVNVLEKLNIQQCVLLGWSLGGHAVLEAMDQVKGLRGVVLTGTPPTEVSTEGFNEVFKDIPLEIIKLLGKAKFEREDAEKFISGVGKEEWMVQYGLACDGRAREFLTKWIGEKTGGDQRKLVAETRVPTALISGEQDPASNKEYLESLKYGNLWGMRFIPDVAHNVVYDKAEAYNAHVLEFLNDVFK